MTLTDADLDAMEQHAIDARVYLKEIGCSDCAENGAAYCEVHGTESDDCDPMRAAVRQLVAEVRRLRARVAELDRATDLALEMLNDRASDIDRLTAERDAARQDAATEADLRRGVLRELGLLRAESHGRGPAMAAALGERDAARLDAATCRGVAEEAIVDIDNAANALHEEGDRQMSSALFKDATMFRARLAHPDAERLRGMVDAFARAAIDNGEADATQADGHVYDGARAALLAALGVPT